MSSKCEICERSNMDTTVWSLTINDRIRLVCVDCIRDALVSEHPFLKGDRMKQEEISNELMGEPGFLGSDTFEGIVTSVYGYFKPDKTLVITNFVTTKEEKEGD